MTQIPPIPQRPQRYWSAQRAIATLGLVVSCLTPLGCSSPHSQGPGQLIPSASAETSAQKSDQTSAQKSTQATKHDTVQEQSPQSAPARGQEIPRSQPAASAIPAALQAGMPYGQARQMLLQAGWRPSRSSPDFNRQDASVNQLFEFGYPEIVSCAGTGEGLCRFEFQQDQQGLLVVIATRNGGKITEQFVRDWFVEPAVAQASPPPEVSAAPTAQAPQPSGTPSTQIRSGNYVLGGTDQGLEVQGQQYRYYDEAGEQEWHPSSELKPVKDGLVFDGQNYWCLLPQPAAGICTAEGWKPLNH